MERRDFLKTSVVAAGLAGALETLEPLTAAADSPAPPASPDSSGAENRSANFLNRAQADPLLPKAPVVVEAAGAVKITPMPLAERIRQKIVPQRGFCSIAPGNDALLSGNGAVNIELAGDPYGEQIQFRHEMLYVPHRRPFEAPNVAEILPQVRQMLLDGNYHDAAQLAYQKWHASPADAGGAGFGGGAGYSMRLEFPGTAAVTDYLRTVDFESTEVKVHWTR